MLNRKTHFVFILVVCIFVFTGQLQASRVLWDVSHGSIEDNNLAGNYNTLARLLEQNQFLISEGNDQLLSHNIWTADVLVISILSNFEDAYSEEEIIRVHAFVESGGGLIILSDNSEVRPNNIAPLLSEFNFVAARNNFISDLSLFVEHPVTDGLERITIRSGGEIGIINQEEALALGRDDWGFLGLAVNESHNGPVILICDADVWHNDLLENQSNTQLALNSFTYADRTSLGRIDGNFNNLSSFLMQGDSEEFILSVRNEGDGVLEIGLEVSVDVNWLSFEPAYASLEAGEDLDISIIVNTDGLVADMNEAAEITIYHSDPTNNFFQTQISITILDEDPTHFEMVAPTGYDHSLLIQELTIDGASTRAGIEVGVFTPNDVCAGAFRYLGEAFGMPARGDDPITNEIEGFLPDERISYKLFIPWENREIGAVPTYLQGGGLFRPDGLSILELCGNPYSNQTISLRNRWNLVSLNVRPNNLNFESILTPLLEEQLILMVKDGRGHFWNIRNGFNNLGDWNLSQGYEICVAHPTELEIEGIEVQADHPILVDPGWSIIPYLLTQPANITFALSSIEENLRFAKQTNGAFYSPEWDWNGIGNMMPGNGYKISMTGEGTLIYSDADEVNMLANTSSFVPSPSGFDMSLLLTDLQPNDRVRLTNRTNIEVGAGIVGDDGRLGMSVWGDDPSTEQLEGLTVNEEFSIQVHESGEWKNHNVEWLQGNNSYSPDGLSVGEALAESILPKAFDISCFPNPFNDRFTINISGGSGQTSVRIYDISGRILETWAGKITDAETSLNFIGHEIPAGVIFINVQVQNQEKIIKAVYLP